MRKHNGGGDPGNIGILPTEHADRAVRECCPFGRTTSTLALLGGCAVVNQWLADRKPTFVFKEVSHDPAA